eukprot:c4578_g1_i1.p1 GENE.c4578_g1_i1~~c4578_g1_i1.p1  ORF type:complete len:501 (+),score=85.35 c4578_g1_i1:76-1578(+)
MSEASWEVLSSAASTQQQDWEVLSASTFAGTMSYSEAARRALQSDPNKEAKPRNRVGQVFRVPATPSKTPRRQPSETSEDQDSMLAPVSFDMESPKSLEGGGHSVRRKFSDNVQPHADHVELVARPTGPFPVTQLFLDLGCSGRDRSFNKSPLQHPEYRQALLNQASSVSVKVDKRFNTVRTTLTLPVIGHIVQGSMSKEDRALGKLAQPTPKRRHLNQSDIFAPPKTTSHFVEPKFLFTRDSPPPLEVSGFPRLRVVLKSRVPTLQQTSTHHALVSKSSPSHCWAPLGTPRFADLDVDLGREMLVTAVSTKGRFPHLTCYPTQIHLDAWGVRSYDGQRYLTVLPSEEPWVVRSYELFYRLTGGREWVSLGVFKGNTDFNTEVAHSLKPFAPIGSDGIKVQHLRFRALNESGTSQMAMRVGVYGSASDCPQQSNPRARNQNTHLDGDEDDAGGQQYVFVEKPNASYLPKSRLRSFMWSRYPGKASRAEHKKEFAQLAKED